ncbi:hypothetical protein Sgleb_07720 [Streptomyces glebosus]|uniref:Molybdopterin dinucleotide-binding domain-containing protein n=1 Tax=Streptomyces glebosus TaxID=249580 RepID=A0A640ST95_9ACTN|nr:hypothetical protein Sgleb_07720 [Streptomyces glebosus]GHG74934.1 hypothetical protein GCM10010513_49120 [Streptomyces glebosus]
MLWISGTNTAVSLPELTRIRAILRDEGLFTVVQDIFVTETAQLADVVLPAATWAEKTGTCTNADRTVHLSEKAIGPPGQARADLDIFLDYARRMKFRDRGGGTLVSWHDPESAFEAWKKCSAGRPCDYTGFTYERLRQAGGIQWPCTVSTPEGTERLYTEGFTWADAALCESYGKDVVTGATSSRTEYQGANPQGKAMIKAVEYLPPHEAPSAEYPLQLITGRTLYHFHTRTKTGRVPQLNAAAPDVRIELSPVEAARYGLEEGDMVEAATPRGSLRGRIRITHIRDGMLFVPFHYGYWDSPTGSGPAEDEGGRAANETIVTDWDPVSKQPVFKTAAARLSLVERGLGRSAPAPSTAASAPAHPAPPDATTGVRGPEPDRVPDRPRSEGDPRDGDAE